MKLLQALLLGCAHVSMPETGHAADKPQPVSTLLAKQIEDMAASVAEDFSEKTLEYIGKFIAIKQEQTRGPAAMALRLTADHGSDAIVDWPEPGSKEGSTGNRLPDKFTTTYIVDGVNKRKPASFYSLVVADTDRGVSIGLAIAELDQIEKLAEPSPQWVDAYGEDKDAKEMWLKYKAYTKAERAQERARLVNDRTNFRGLVVKGTRVVKHMAKVNAMSKVGVTFAYEPKKTNDKDEERVLKNTPAIVVLYSKGEQGGAFDPTADVSTCTIDTFLSYKVDTAIANGGSLKDLIATAARDTGNKSPQKDSKNKVPAISNRNMLGSFINELASYIGTNEGKAEMLALTAEKDEGKMTIIALCIIADRIDSITSKQRHVYEKHLEEQTDKAHKAA